MKAERWTGRYPILQQHDTGSIQNKGNCKILKSQRRNQIFAEAFWGRTVDESSLLGIVMSQLYGAYGTNVTAETTSYGLAWYGWVWHEAVTDVSWFGTA